MDNFIYHTVTTVRYYGIFLLMMLFPAETVMLVAGYVAAAGGLSLGLVIAAGAAGSTLGSIIVYGFARSIDKGLFYRAVDRYGRFIGLRRGNIETVGGWFNGHARLAVFAARFVPALRTAVSVPAGFERMRPTPFVLFTLLGTVVDTVLLAGAGYLAQDRINQLLHVTSDAANYITIGLAILLVAVLYRRGRQKRHHG